MNGYKEYLILDAARCNYEAIQAAIDKCRELNTFHDSLYQFNNKIAHLLTVAPYIFEDKNGSLKNWFMQEGWGKSWGMIVQSAVPFEQVRYHLRKFLKVRTEDYKEMFFRYYDPRVLRVFLPSCNGSQLVEFFGSIHQMICESEDAGFAYLFSAANSQLQQKKVPVTEIWKQATLPEAPVLAPPPPPAEAGEPDAAGTPVEQKPRRRFFF